MNTTLSTPNVIGWAYQARTRISSKELDPSREPAEVCVPVPQVFDQATVAALGGLEKVVELFPKMGSRIAGEYFLA